MNIYKQVSKSPTKSSKPLKGETEKTFGFFSKLWRVCCLTTFGNCWRPPLGRTGDALAPTEPRRCDQPNTILLTGCRLLVHIMSTDYPWCHLLSYCTLTSQIISKNNLKFELRPQDLFWIWFTLIPTVISGPCSLMWRWGRVWRSQASNIGFQFSPDSRVVSLIRQKQTVTTLQPSPEDSRFSGVLCQGTIETYSSSHLIPNDSNIFSVSSFHVTSSMKNTGRQHLTTCCSYF